MILAKEKSVSLVSVCVHCCGVAGWGQCVVGGKYLLYIQEQHILNFKDLHVQHVFQELTVSLTKCLSQYPKFFSGGFFSHEGPTREQVTM